MLKSKQKGWKIYVYGDVSMTSNLHAREKNDLPVI